MIGKLCDFKRCDVSLYAVVVVLSDALHTSIAYEILTRIVSWNLISSNLLYEKKGEGFVYISSSRGFTLVARGNNKAKREIKNSNFLILKSLI